MIRSRPPLVFWIAIVVWVILVTILPGSGSAQPRSGDVFREYRWTNMGGDSGGAFRVGGRLDYGGGPIELSHDIDLEHATRAEVVVEKLLCHDSTRGLAISWNGNPWIAIPEAGGIPFPQWEYQHHIYPTVDVPLQQLVRGGMNQFRMKVDKKHAWNWPQNLIYGVHLRVYYDASRKPHPDAQLIAPGPNASLSTTVELQVNASNSNGRIARVDFLGRFEDVNLEGDGLYNQWHYHYVRSKLNGHIGTATAAPWRVTWDTTWIPDQPEPFQLAAWVSDDTGLTLFSESVCGLTLDRQDRSVELCKPYDVPKRWVTRKGEHEERFRVEGDLAKATAARLVWCSWSPGYMEGLLLDGRHPSRRLLNLHGIALVTTLSSRSRSRHLAVNDYEICH